MFRSLLLPLDLSPVSDRVIGRAALLPLAHDARLTLLHVVPGTLPAPARKRAQADAQKTLDAEERALTKILPRGVAVESVVAVGSPKAEIVELASSTNAELIVMGRGGGRALRDVFLGSTAERVIRRGQLPVLVVRLRPREPYRRPALALDVDQAAHSILELLLRVVPPPRPRIEIIHAYDAPYHGMIYPSLSKAVAAEYRDHYRHKARHELGELLATALADAKVPPDDAPSWKTHVRYGPPRTIIENTVKERDTDLLVLGTHARAGIAHAFLGTVAGDVLREVACDVLAVPPRRGTTRNG